MGCSRRRPRPSTCCGVVLTAPLQALARLHTAAATGLVPDDALGRPRLAGETCGELDRPRAGAGCRAGDGAAAHRGRGAARDASPAGGRRGGRRARRARHGAPFVRGNAVVARALDRAVVHAGGLDPTGVAVTEAGHGAQGGAAYLGALTAYGRVTRREWGCGSRTAAAPFVRPLPRGSAWRMRCSPDDSPVGPCPARGRRSRTSGDGPPRGAVTTKLPRTGRVPTRGQSTDGPIVMGSTQHDDGMEHAWSPTRSTAGRRLRPITGTEAPPRAGPSPVGLRLADGCCRVGALHRVLIGVLTGPIRWWSKIKRGWPTFGFHRERALPEGDLSRSRPGLALGLPSWDTMGSLAPPRG